MADGSFRPVAELGAGDLIARPSGPGRVAFVGQPLRNGRPLFSFKGEDFRFTATHPFVTACAGSGGPKLAAVDPIGLDVAVPTFGRAGIASLVPGTRLAGNAGGAVRSPDIERHDDAVPDEVVYDLVPEPGVDGSFDYFIGAPGKVMRTTAEIPLAARAPLAGRVLVEAVQAAMPLMRICRAGNGRTAFQEDLFRFHRLLSAGAVGDALGRIGSVVTAEAAVPGAPLGLAAAALSPLVRSFAAEDGGGDWVAGGIFETLIRTLGPEVEAALALPWRLPGMPYGDRLALSVSDLHFLDANAVPLAERTELLLTYAVRNRPPWSVKLHDDGPRSNTPFARFFDQVVYIPARPSDPGDGAELQLSLFCGDEAAPSRRRDRGGSGISGLSPPDRGLALPRQYPLRPGAHGCPAADPGTANRASSRRDAAWSSAQQSAFVHQFSRALIEVVSGRINELHASQPSAADCRLVKYLPAIVSILALIAFVAAIAWADQRGRSSSSGPFFWCLRAS